MKKKILLILIPLMIVLAGVGVGGYSIYNNNINIDTIYPGVKIEEIEVGNMTKDDALNHIKETKDNQILEKSMKLVSEEETYDIGLKELGYSYDYEKAVDEAYELGREGKLLQRYREIEDIKKKGSMISLEHTHDTDKLDEEIDKISAELNQESLDAKFNFNGGNIIIDDEVIGKEVDGQKLSELIKENIEELKDLQIPVEIIEPEYTKEYYAGINGVIGEYSTAFPSSTPGRKSNIRLSVNMLNGKMLHPGESLSFNSAVGPVTKANGYSEASVIINGQFDQGVGGGICQTSTTLYNALVAADLTIVERHPHSIPINYVSKGTDAAVASDYLDLKFRNDFDFPIYISSSVAGDKAYFHIYGDKTKKDYSVVIQPEITQTIPHKVIENQDSSLAPGTRELVQEGRDGYKVKTYKSKIKNGKVIEREHISSDYYREKDFIYKVGPPKPQAAAPKPAAPKPAAPEKPKPDPEPEPEKPTVPETPAPEEDDELEQKPGE